MSELSEKVLNFTTKYLGPASKTFLERQTKGHMGGLSFDQLKNEDLPELFKWIKISSQLLIGEKAEEMIKRMEIVFNVKSMH
jgi:hypothetical protein